MDTETIAYDVLIVGGGPAGLTAAIRIKQLSPSSTVCVLEKGAYCGAHVLSGAVLDPRALDELWPDWRAHVPSTETRSDRFLFLTQSRAFSLPVPPSMQHRGQPILSLGRLCAALSEYASSLGVDVFAGFPAEEVLFNESRTAVIGVRTRDQGRDAEGKATERYQPGVCIHARYTLLAEGCRGSLSERLMDHFHLREGRSPQTYGLGIKELWELPEDHPGIEEGAVYHTVGWPLDRKTYGGGFVYHLSGRRVAVGFVVGLDYQDPHLSPFVCMQRFKTHPRIRCMLEGGKRLRYGARALNEGGWQSIPKLTFQGGALIGCAAGFMDVPRIQGTHHAMKSAMLAAQSCVEALAQGKAEMSDYEPRLKKSWVGQELYRSRNIRPAFRWGFWFAMAYAAFDTYLLRGRAPWTFAHHQDHEVTQRREGAPSEPFVPDGTLTFDRLSSVFLSQTHHEEHQACHLKLKDPSLAIAVNYQQYGSPEQYYCPAAVYEIVEQPEGPKLEIHAQNCIHCKTCDIKDPTQNIVWTVPEGGGGPQYEEM